MLTLSISEQEKQKPKKQIVEGRYYATFPLGI
jgi:hypothetical protein